MMLAVGKCLNFYIVSPYVLTEIWSKIKIISFHALMYINFFSVTNRTVNLSIVFTRNPHVLPATKLNVIYLNNIYAIHY